MLQTLSKISESSKTSRGTRSVGGIENQFLTKIRSTKAIIHVLRCFKNENDTPRFHTKN
jgi:ribosome-binding ATPase YchF (GTP1/OBG family)